MRSIFSFAIDLKVLIRYSTFKDIINNFINPTEKLSMRWCVLLFAAICVLSSCSFIGPTEIRITDAKTVTGVDEKLMPVHITNAFPGGTSKVVCWFQWKEAKVNVEVTAKWHYVTDDIHILDYPFRIPKKTGAGSVALSAPEGKSLPGGLYKVELAIGNRVLKSVNFTIE